MLGKRMGAVITSLAILLVTLIPLSFLPKPVEAWNGGTHGWMGKSLEDILKWNWQNNPGVYGDAKNSLREIIDFFESTDGRNCLGYLWRGMMDADTEAYERNGNGKTYHFETKLWGILRVTFDVDSYKLLGTDLPWWLSILYPLFILNTHYATIDQYQYRDTHYKLPIFCKNLRTAGETANDYIYLAHQAWKAQRRHEAMWWLGMACHMAQDCCFPFHALQQVPSDNTAWAYYRQCNDAEQYQDDWKLSLNSIDGFYKDQQITDDQQIFSTYTGHIPPSFASFFKYSFEERIDWTAFDWVSDSAIFAGTYREFSDGVGYEDSGITRKYGLVAAQLRTAQLVFYFLRNYFTGGLPTGYGVQFIQPSTTRYGSAPPTYVMSGQELLIAWEWWGSNVLYSPKLRMADLLPVTSSDDPEASILSPIIWSSTELPGYSWSYIWRAPLVSEPMKTQFMMDSLCGGFAFDWTGLVIIMPPTWRSEQITEVLFSAVTTATKVKTTTLYMTYPRVSTVRTTRTTMLATTGIVMIPTWRLTTITWIGSSTKTFWTNTTITSAMRNYTTTATVQTLRTSTTTSTVTNITSYLTQMPVIIVGTVTTAYPTETLTTIMSTSTSTATTTEVATRTYIRTSYATQEPPPLEAFGGFSLIMIVLLLAVVMILVMLAVFLAMKRKPRAPFPLGRSQRNTSLGKLYYYDRATIFLDETHVPRPATITR